MDFLRRDERDHPLPAEDLPHHLPISTQIVSSFVRRT
jgi:hypothetical protein